MATLNNSSLHHLATTDLGALCLQTRSILDSRSYLAILILEIALNVPALLANLILMSFTFRLTVYHSNLRCLLFHHSFNLALFSVSTTARAAYMLVVGYAADGGDPCRLITSMYTCKLQELITIMPIINSIYSFTIVCLERLYATLTYRTYDSTSRVPWLAICLIPAVWVISLVYQLNPLPSIPHDRYLPVCANLLAISRAAAVGSLIQCLIMESLAFVLVIVLYYINSRKMNRSLMNRAKHSLTARFQIAQNVEVNSLLIPSLLAHAACFLPITGYLILVTCEMDFDLNTKMLLIHAQYVWISFYASAHPILAFAKDSHFRKIYRAAFPSSSSWNWCRCLAVCKRGVKAKATRRTEPADQYTPAELHFKSLEAMWNK